MPLYDVRWYERILHSTIIEAESEELAAANFGESDDDQWIDSEFLGLYSVHVIPKEYENATS
jgi:hypothetical protein